MTQTTERINCRKCRHYFVTWEPKQPHGCQLFGFKSAMLPCLVVQRTSEKNIPCQYFSPRHVSPSAS